MENVIRYFTGEQAESYLFLAMGLLGLSLGMYLLVATGDAFLKGVAIPLAAMALLELVVGYTIVTRSPKDIERVRAMIDNPTELRTKEVPRMQTVFRNFVIYRYAEMTLIAAGIALMYGGAAHGLYPGIGVGLFSQASIVLLLDFFAERRAHEYMAHLQSLVS
ncbi:MAG: hypothetical protein ACKOB6_02195 [Candidatus Kapaibacterium sp.]